MCIRDREGRMRCSHKEQRRRSQPFLERLICFRRRRRVFEWGNNYTYSIWKVLCSDIIYLCLVQSLNAKEEEEEVKRYNTHNTKNQKNAGRVFLLRFLVEKMNLIGYRTGAAASRIYLENGSWLFPHLSLCFLISVVSVLYSLSLNESASGSARFRQKLKQLN